MVHRTLESPVVCILAIPAERLPVTNMEIRMTVQGRRATNLAHPSKILAIASCNEGVLIQHLSMTHTIAFLTWLVADLTMEESNAGFFVFFMKIIKKNKKKLK